MTDTANKYMTSSIMGLSPPMGTINTAVYAGMDGSYLNNAFIEKRNIVITFEMRGMDVKTHRHQKRSDEEMYLETLKSYTDMVDAHIN